MASPAVGPPKTLPADFQGWDAPQSSAPPAVLPADFGGWDKPAAQTPAPAQPDYGSTSHQLGVGIVKGMGNTISGVSDMIHAIPGVGPKLIPDSGLQGFHAYNTPETTAQKVGYGGEQLAEWLTPTGLEEKAGLAAGKAIPAAAKLFAPVVKAGTAALESGVRNKLQGGSFGAGAAAGGIGSGIVQGAKAIAPTMAESALGVRNTDRAYGRTPGQAILEDTTGVRPGTVAASAQSKLGELNPQLEGMADASQTPASLSPARQMVDDAIAKAQSQNNAPALKDLNKLRNQISTNVTTGTPLSQNQSASGLLNIKRGVGDSIGTWNPLTASKQAQSTAKGVYGSLDNEFDRVVPGASDLNQRISSLIPVAKRATGAELNAGVTQNVLSKFAKPTGALAGGLFGAHEGYDHGGVTGGIVGGLAGLAAPAVIATPTFGMTAARSLYGGLLPNALVPAAKGALLPASRSLFSSNQPKK